MTEEVTTTVQAFYLNDDEENKPAKIQAGDNNYYSTFKPGEHLPDGKVSEGDEIRIEYVESQQGDRTFRNIEEVEIVDTGTPKNGSSSSDSGSGYVSGVDRQTSIEAQGLLKEARETELSLSARRDDYEFTDQGVKQRAVEYAGILKDLKKEIARQ